MRSLSSREIMKQLIEEGWIEVACVGDHHQFKHPTIPGRVTLTHPVKDVPIATIKSIERQSGITFK